MALLTNINGKFSVSDAGAVTFNNAFTFPTTDGTANYVLKTNGSGTVSWSPDANTGTVTGTGTANTMPVWTSASALGNSIITQPSSANVRVSGSSVYFSVSDTSAAARNIDIGHWVAGQTNIESVGGILSIGTQSNHDIVFETNGSTKATILANGNVGIGTTSPNSRLTVQAAGSQTTQRGITLFHNNTIANGYISVGAQYTATNGYIDSEIRFGGETLNGACSFISFATGCNNTITQGANSEKIRINSEGCIYNVNSYTSTFFGLDTGNIANQTGVHNAGFGHKALEDMTTGQYNTGLGAFALENNTTGSENTAVGYAALYNGIAVGNKNTAVGSIALGKVTTGYQNIGIGAGSGQNITTGNNNVNIGTNAGYTNVDGIHNTYIGTGAGYTSPGQNYNTCVGHEAGFYNTGNGTVLIGRYAGRDNTADYTVAVGYNAALYNTTGGQNTAVGFQALINYKTVSFNTAVGYMCMAGGSASGPGNIGTQNTMMGRYTGHNIITGNNNSGFGMEALYACTAGNNNTAVGSYASQLLTTGGFNVALGQQALRNSIDGFENVAAGFQAGYNVTNGHGNTLIGQDAGGNITTGSNNVCLGNGAQTPSNSSTNTVVLGNSNINSLRCQVQTISGLSDKRDKTNIKDSEYGLDLISSLKPVTFEWNQRDGHRKGLKDLGFIAQDLQKVDDEHLSFVSDEDPEKLSASYGRLIPVLVKAIQELKAEIEILKNK